MIGKLRTAGAHLDDFYVQHAVVGELLLGQHWAGEANKSAKLPAGSFVTLGLREVVVTGAARLEGVKAARLGLLAFATFLGPVDLANAEFPTRSTCASEASVRTRSSAGWSSAARRTWAARASTARRILSSVRSRGAMVDLNRRALPGRVDVR